MTSDPRLRVGIIGTGWMADMIVPDFRRVDAFDLVAVAGRDAGRTRAFTEERGIPVAETVDGLLGRDDLDLVYIATTHDSHAELARRALEHGIPVLLEKAFTMNAAEAEGLIELARDRGVFLMEAMWMRFNPAVRRVAELLAEGAIGEPRHLTASFGFSVTDAGHRLWDPEHGGGSALDQGVYPLALADLLFGGYDTLAATGSRLGPDGAPGWSTASSRCSSATPTGGRRCWRPRCGRCWPATRRSAARPGASVSCPRSGRPRRS